MSAIVVDASVAVKWFLPEEHAREAFALHDASFNLIAPDLLVAELSNVLTKRSRRGELPQDQARRAVMATGRLLAFRPMLPLVPAALEMALRLSCSVYDAIYVAVAIREQCQLITADRRLCHALERPLPGIVRWIGDPLTPSG